LEKSQILIINRYYIPKVNRAKDLKGNSDKSLSAMRLTQKKIEDILVGILGEDGLPLIRELYGKENVSEFDLAHRTKKDIKVIRKQLYLLNNHNVIGFNRKKDKQKGWYIYYWTLLPENIKFAYTKRKNELLVKLKERLGEEQRELFYVCSQRCTRLNFDQAMDFEFKCPECGELVSQDKSEENIANIQKRISVIEEELEQIKKEERKAPRAAEPKTKKKSLKKKVKVVKKSAVKKKLVKIKKKK